MKALFAALATAAALAVGAPASAQPPEYSFAVVPQFTPETIFETWGPVLDRVGALAGVKLKLVTYRSIPEFERSFQRGDPDFAYLNPYHALMANAAQGYVPFLRDDSRPLKGVLVVRADSPVRTVRDLEGKEVAFPAPNAFAASLYMRALLDEKEKVRIRPRYVATHANTYRHVILGTAAAGGGLEQTLEFEPPEVRAELRVLYTTPPTPSHPIVAHPRVNPAVVARVADAFRAAAADPANGKLLQLIQFTQPKRTDLRDYLPLQQLQLERYVVPAGP